MDPNLPSMPAQYRGGEDGRADIAREKKERMEVLLAFSGGEARSTSGTDASALRPHSIQNRSSARAFKISVVAELESGKPPAQIAREHSIHPGLPYRWRDELVENP